jgi:hypothetical protein
MQQVDQVEVGDKGVDQFDEGFRDGQLRAGQIVPI